MDQFWFRLSGIPSVFLQSDWITLGKILLQVVVLVYAFVWMWKRIRGTQAERLVKGVLVISSFYLFSWLAGLTLITSILQHTIPVALMGLVIIFQPEVRRGLGYLGRTAFKVDFSLSDSKEERTAEVIRQIIAAVKELSKDRVGGLIVVEPPESEHDYLTPGVPINADVTSVLLLAIFTPKSPLHDGACVIRENKIVAAGVILPMTDNPKLSHKYGTRHRAAIGLSEAYDGLCIVVSEETGAVSAANRGMLKRVAAADELAEPLSYIYHKGVAEPVENPFQSFLKLFEDRKRSFYGTVSSTISMAQGQRALGKAAGDAAHTPGPGEAEHGSVPPAAIEALESLAEKTQSGADDDIHPSPSRL